MATGYVFAGLPSPSLFSFPPNNKPTFIAPPPPGSISSAPPFHIPDHIYQAALDVRVPVTIAAVYAVTAKALNAYNKSTGKRPWAISKTQAFRVFVIVHNIFLAIYSAWTFCGMLGTLRRSMVNPLGPDGLPGFMDSVCRLNGPAGLGNAAYFSEVTQSWQTHSSAAALAGNGLPNQLDRGRIWNEGLAFYGWIFYLSKFYEVLDTFIILAKGKFSSTLQTYHHAGAMMCMWAGMRYMSAPIWMFVFVNSGIHAMMYTYYTLTAFNVRVPVFIKRILTTLQIIQFVVGAAYAMVHSFVHYTVPAAAPTSQPTVVANVTKPQPTPAVLESLKAVLFGQRAAGAAAGVAAYGQQTVPCVTTTGATFAIWLNVLYLAPLTYLFAKFFVESYLRRSSADYKNQSAARAAHRRRLSNEVVLAEKAGWDAARGIEREVYGQDGVEEPTPVFEGSVADGAAKANGARKVSGPARS